jgi:hypothetical protein
MTITISISSGDGHGSHFFKKNILKKKVDGHGNFILKKTSHILIKV